MVSSVGFERGVGTNMTSALECLLICAGDHMACTEWCPLCGTAVCGEWTQTWETLFGLLVLSDSSVFVPAVCSWFNAGMQAMFAVTSLLVLVAAWSSHMHRSKIVTPTQRMWYKAMAYLSWALQFVHVGEFPSSSSSSFTISLILE